jgi:hypothetical protein
MNKQPEARRLAEELHYDFNISYASSAMWRAADELRRLHEANQAMLEALKRAEQSLGAFVSDHGWSQQDMDNLDTVTAAIAKGEQQ